MKKLFMLFCFVVLSLTSVVGAQEQGRPDPTGKGRYVQFGHESLYEGARVAKELPSGTECASAGELIGVKVWNSTREGKAILSELTDKALVAVTSDGKIFLCECAGGFNQLFLINSTPPPTSPTVLQEATPQVVVNVTQQNNNPPAPQVVEEKEQLPPIFDSNVPTQGQERKTSRIYKYRYRIGGAAAVIGTAAWAGRYFWCLW